MIRLIFGALLSAVVLFAWGFVFWAVSGIMYQFIHRLPNEDEVSQALQKTDPDSGTYRIPFPDPAAMSGSDKDKEAALKTQNLKGPLIEIIYRKEGLDPTRPQEYAVGFCHFLAASLLAGMLLILSQPGLPRYWMRVAFVTLAGVFATVAVSFAGPIWFHHPWAAVLYTSAYQVIGWLLAGLVLGWVLRPANAAEQKI